MRRSIKIVITKSRGVKGEITAVHKQYGNVVVLRPIGASGRSQELFKTP